MEWRILMGKRGISTLSKWLCLTVLLGLLVGCSLNPVENYNTSKQKETSSIDHRRYLRLTPEYEVEDFEYIEDGNGIVIDWKVTNQDELDKNNGVEEDFAATSQSFIVRNNMKLRSDVASKEMADDEYFYLDIFDLRGSSIPKKKIDLWELTQEYLQDDHYKLFGVGSTGIYEKNGEFFVSVGVRKGKVKKYLSLNLDTLKIVGEIPESQADFRTNHFDSVWAKSGDEQIFHRDYYYTKSDKYKGTINLKNAFPSAWELFGEEDAVAYRLVNLQGDSVTNASQLLDVYSLFLDEGVSIYDVGVLDAIATSDGQEHRITKFEDIEKYSK